MLRQDIDAILAGRTEKRQIGSAAGNTFSTATFAAEPAVRPQSRSVSLAAFAWVLHAVAADMHVPFVCMLSTREPQSQQRVWRLVLAMQGNGQHPLPCDNVPQSRFISASAQECCTVDLRRMAVTHGAGTRRPRRASTSARTGPPSCPARWPTMMRRCRSLALHLATDSVHGS